MRKYYAKSVLLNGKQPTVQDHLIKVSEKAKEYGQMIDCGEKAELAGLFHDFGKYSQDFSDVLTGKKTHVDHAIGGAAYLYCLYSKTKYAQACEPVIEAIYGHHDGLEAFGIIKDRLKDSLQNNRKIENSAGKHASLAGETEYGIAQRAFNTDFPGRKLPLLQPYCSHECPEVEKMLFTRMLFSCLVDADHSISASDENDAYFDQTESAPFTPEVWLEKLYEYRDALRKGSRANADLNALRDQVFEDCGKAGEGEEGLYTLTAPTGTGKTLALLHFALRHSIFANKKRTIVVLPYLTLTEQSATEYSKIIPDILLDHSQSDLPDDKHELAAKWSAPFIITTSVRFFETLFRHKPQDLRKLHNIANSVILFDEAQSLPADVTIPTLFAVKELCRQYHCTVLFSTATQPDFQSISRLNWQPCEILPKHKCLYDKLRRTKVEWLLDKPVPLTEIASEMAQEKSVCAIVNTRDHARKLYKALKQFCAADEIFFLTTDLCAADRLKRIEVIRERLSNKLPCRVVSTQCIEAGVDLDFGKLYRALAPLESIIQAAGRCNRNGIATLGTVVVFLPDEEGSLYPGKWYETAAKIVARMVSDGETDIHDTDLIRAYYSNLFTGLHTNDLTDPKSKGRLAEAIRNYDYPEVSNEYRLISDGGNQVIVPSVEHPEAYESVRAELQGGVITHKLMKQAAPVSVNSYSKDLDTWAEKLYYTHNGVLEASGWYILREQYRDRYTADMGLQLGDEVAPKFLY